MEIATIFEPKVVICKLCKAIFSTHYNIFQTAKFWYFTTFERFFPGISFFCLDKKLVDNASCPFGRVSRMTIVYALCTKPRLRPRPGNKSHQNEAGRSRFASFKFVCAILFPFKSLYS